MRDEQCSELTHSLTLDFSLAILFLIACLFGVITLPSDAHQTLTFDGADCQPTDCNGCLAYLSSTSGKCSCYQGSSNETNVKFCIAGTKDDQCFKSPVTDPISCGPGTIWSCNAPVNNTCTITSQCACPSTGGTGVPGFKSFFSCQ